MKNGADLVERLFLFVKCESCVDDVEISMDTRLEDDLGVYGDDAVDFIVKYSDTFNVDVSDFNIKDFFSPEQDLLSKLLFMSGFLRKPFTVRDLYNGILEKKLGSEER